jgi:ankyrin repeat protein
MNGIPVVHLRIRWSVLLVLLIVAVLNAGCTMTPEKAKDQLAERKVPFTIEAMRAAIQRNEPEVVELFLLAGMNPNEHPQVKPGRPVPEDNLQIAVRTGCKETIKALIDGGANVNSRNNLGETPLLSALVRDDPEIVKLLIDKGADIRAETNYNQTVTVAAIQMGKLEALKLFLAKGVDVNAEDRSGGTLLFHAAGSINNEITKLLIELGGDINRPNQDGVTPLLRAVTRDQLENVRLLLARGADVYLRDLKGTSPLMMASSRNRLDIMQALMDKGAPADMDALVKAAEVGHEEGVRLLLERNRDSLVPFAAKALTLAAANGNTSVVSTLIEYGVPVDSKDSYGETAIVKAAREGHDGTVEVLLEKGADPALLGATMRRKR